VAALVGSLIVAGAASAMGVITLPMVAVCSLAGFIGTNVDSLVGATLENGGYIGNAGTKPDRNTLRRTRCPGVLSVTRTITSGSPLSRRSPFPSTGTTRPLVSYSPCGGAVGKAPAIFRKKQARYATTRVPQQVRRTNATAAETQIPSVPIRVARSPGVRAAISVEFSRVRGVSSSARRMLQRRRPEKGRRRGLPG